jgi:hypothetical protein
MTLAEYLPNAPKRRQERDIERIRRAAAEVPAEQRSAMTMALAQISAAFDAAAVVNAFKFRVEHLLRLGPPHPAVRARLGARAEMLAGRGLDAAIVVAERWWRDERRAFQIASVFGCASRLSLEVLRELRLILRWMRFKRMGAQYSAISKRWARRRPRGRRNDRDGTSQCPLTTGPEERRGYGARATASARPPTARPSSNLPRAGSSGTARPRAGSPPRTAT